jgi:hypothetical protein
MLTIKNKKSLHVALAAFLAVSSLSGMVFVQKAHAGSLSQVMVRFDTMRQGVSTSGAVCAKPVTVGTEAKVMITYPTGFTFGAYTTFAVNTTDTNNTWPSGGTAWPGITAPASAGAISGQTVTFASGDLTVGTLYCFNWTGAGSVVQPGSASANEIGSVTTQTSTPTTIDTAQFATATLTDDRITVNATVPPTFSFQLANTTDNLGSLTTSGITSSAAPATVTVGTNAKNGWMVWAKDANAGLLSATASKTIASTTPGTIGTLTSNTEGYNTKVTTSDGSTTIATPFNGGATAGRGSGLDTTLRLIASSSTVANGSTVNANLTNNVTIAGNTPAANDYTDTITVVGAGLF